MFVFVSVVHPLLIQMYMKWVADDSLQYLFSDWSGSRGAEGRSDPLMEHGGEEEMFVSYTPSPRNAMEHIQRRNSTSASYGRAVDSSGGFAKKVVCRWIMGSGCVKVNKYLFRGPLFLLM